MLLKNISYKSMKKKYLISITVTLVLLTIVIISLFTIKNKKTILKDEEIFATYKNGNIYVKDVKNYIKNLEKIFNQKLNINNLKKEEKEIIVNEIINNKIILEQAKESKISKTEEYKNRTKEVEETLLKEMYLEDLINKNITDEAVKAKYNEIVKLLTGKKEFKVKHIVVKTKEDIQKVIEELKTKTFEEVAIKYSIDSSKETGGELGYVVEGQTIPEFETILKAQPLNKLSKPFETQFGWHVLIKEDEREATIPEFDKTKDIIKNTLTRDYIKDLSLKNIKNMDIKIKK